MSRAIGTVAVLAVLAAVLPTIAGAAQAAVPFLLSLLVFLGIARLVLPPTRRRR